MYSGCLDLNMGRDCMADYPNELDIEPIYEEEYLDIELLDWFDEEEWIVRHPIYQLLEELE